MERAEVVCLLCGATKQLERVSDTGSLWRLVTPSLIPASWPVFISLKRWLARHIEYYCDSKEVKS